MSEAARKNQSRLEWRIIRKQHFDIWVGFLRADMVTQKPFHVVGMIISYNILGQKFVMIIGKQISYWSKTGFFLVF